MSFKFWNKFFIITVFSIFFIIATFNFSVNPYKLFNHNMFSNYLVIKNHIISERMQTFYQTVHDNPTNIIMGTSRIGMLSPTDISKYLNGSTNSMSMAGSNIEEQSQYLLYMIKNHDIKNIVWALDFCSFNPDLPNDRDFTYDRLNGSSSFNNDHRVALISFQTTKNSFKTLKENYKASLKEKQNYTLTDKDKESNKHKHYNNFTKKQIDEYTQIQLQYYPQKYLLVKTFNKPHSIDKNLEKVQKVITQCKNNNINISIYTSPVSKDFLQLYKDLGLEDSFIYWKKILQKISSYIDFCNYNDITKNPYNFIDGTHIMPKFSPLIFARIFNDKSINVPKNFGKKIQKN